MLSCDNNCLRSSEAAIWDARLVVVRTTCEQFLQKCLIPTGRSSEFIETIKDFIHDITTVQLWDTVLGVLMIAFILILWVSPLNLKSIWYHSTIDTMFMSTET